MPTWFAENIGTFSHVWLYPQQLSGWAMVRVAKLGAWFLLFIISYTLVAAVNRPVAVMPTPSPAKKAFAPSGPNRYH